MLYLQFFKKISPYILFVFLLFIPIVSFQTQSFAQDNIKEKLAEEYRVKGLDEQDKGNLNSALNYFNKAYSLGAQDSALLNDIGVIYEQIGLKKKAEEHYLKAIRNQKDYLPAYMNLAYLYQNSGNEQKAAEYFKLRYELSEVKDQWTEKAKNELIKIKPEYRAWILNQEERKLHNEMLQRAQADFLNDLRMSAEHFKRGNIYYQRNSFQDALDQYNQALQLTPRNPKIVEAREKTYRQITKQNIKQYSKQAIEMLDAGDTRAANQELQKILTTIPNKSLSYSK